MDHPTETDLRGLLAGELRQPDAARVGSHLDACPECRTTAERLTAVPADVRASLLVAIGSRSFGESTPSIPQVHGYTDFQELGRGGCGVVYRAWDVAAGRSVAVKLLRGGVYASRAERAWFLAEAATGAKLKHPNIVDVLAVGDASTTPYFVMEFVRGGSLAGKLAGTPTSDRVAARLVRTVAAAVHFAHQSGVIHRDLKPGNILLDDGDDPFATPKVTDFGMAKQNDPSEFPTPTQAVLGTPSYMAPEQAFGRAKQVGPTADVYSLGAILYEMLTGRPPFKGETPYETLLQVRSHNPVWPRRLRPDVPKSLEAVCLKCLEQNPANRYPTAEALADDLGRFLQGTPVSARLPGPLRKSARWARANPSASILSAVLAGVVFLGFVAVSVLWLRAERQADEARRSAVAATASRLKAREALVLYAGTATRLFRNTESITAAEKADLIRFIHEAEEVLSATTGDPDEEHDAAYALLQLADGLHNLRESAAAVAPCRRGHEVLRRLAAEHPDRDRFVFHHSEACSQLAGTLVAAGQTGEYETLVREAIRSAEIVNRRRPDNTGVQAALASYEDKLAVYLMQIGKLVEAQERFAAAVTITRRLFDANPSDPIRCARHIESLYTHARLQFFLSGRADALLAAARYQIKTFQSCKHLHPKPDWMPTLNQLASTTHAVVALDRVGRSRDADELMDESLRTASELAALDPATSVNRYQHASLLSLDAHRSWGTDPPRARASYNQAVRITEQAISDKNWDSFAARTYLVDCLVKCPDPVLRDTMRAVATARQVSGEPRFRDSLGIALFEAGEFAEACQILAEHIRWAETNARPSAQVRSRSYLARALWQSGQQVAARVELRRLEDQLRQFVICEISELYDRDAAWQLIEGKDPPPPWQRGTP